MTFRPYQVGVSYSGGPMTSESVRWHSQWKPTTNGAIMGWGVARSGEQPEWLTNKRGITVCFKTYEAAQRRADKLNNL